MSNIRPEQQVLFLISKQLLSVSDVEELERQLTSNVDWHYLVQTARLHGLIPLLQKNTATHVPELIPPHIRTQLKREAVENMQSVLYLTAKAIEVSRAFDQKGVQNAIFKGPILAKLAYGDLALRQAGDIDLMIARDDFDTAKDVLESLGFDMYPRQLTPAQLRSHLGFHCEMQFTRDDWFTVVDLHWGLSPRSFIFALGGREVMSRLQTVEIYGSPLKTFSTEDLILYQAMHGAKHLWKKLESITSIAELTKQCDNLWTTILERAVRARATKMLGLGLRLAELVHDISVPAEVMLTVDRDESMKRLAAKTLTHIFGQQQGPIESTESNIYNLKIMDRRRDAILSAFRATFVPTLSDWEALTLPGSLHSLYYAYRPLRLSRIYGASLLNRLRSAK